MLELILTNKAEVQRLAVVLLVISSWRWGAGPERASAASLLVFVVADPIYHALIGRQTGYMAIELGHLALDCLVAGFLVAIALRANRVYPLWLAAFQGIAVLSHAGRGFSHSAAPLAYSIITFAPSYLIILTLATGIAFHARRIARRGEYPSWWNDCPPWRTSRSCLSN